MDDEPGGLPERPPFRVQTRGQYGRSIARDLQWLLNTRCTVRDRRDRKDDEGVHGRTVLDFGLRDFTHLAPASWDDRQRLERELRETIEAFEPRLRLRRVRVEPREGHHRSAVAYIEAQLLGEGVQEPVSFRLVLDGSEGNVRVDGR